MRSHFFITLITLLATAGTRAESPAELPSDAAPIPSEVVELIQTTTDLFIRDRFEDVLFKLDAAPLSISQHPKLLNIRGAALLELREFQSARRALLQARQKAPSDFWPAFNLAELEFVQGKYRYSLRLFQELEKQFPDSDLIRFKIFLSLLMNGETSQARKLLNQLDYPATSPLYFFCQAAWEFKKHNTTQARDHLESATALFPDQLSPVYFDTLADLGWHPYLTPAD